MEREWWIQIDGHQEGPYNIAELERDLRLNGDTLVWKKGFPAWVPLAAVEELRSLLNSKQEPEVERAEEEEEERKREAEQFSARITPDGLVIDACRGPPNFLLWLLIAIILGVYFAYKFWS